MLKFIRNTLLYIGTKSEMEKLEGRFVVDEWTPPFLSQNSVDQLDGDVDVVAHSSTTKHQKRQAEEEHEHNVAGKRIKLKEKHDKEKENKEKENKEKENKEKEKKNKEKEKKNKEKEKKNKEKEKKKTKKGKNKEKKEKTKESGMSICLHGC